MLGTLTELFLATSSRLNHLFVALFSLFEPKLLKSGGNGSENAYAAVDNYLDC